MIAVVDAKPCGLPKQRLKAEGGAEVRVQLALEVGGREIMPGHHVAPEAGDQPLLQRIEEAVAKDRATLVPVHRQLAQMQPGRQRIAAVKSGRLGAGGRRRGGTANKTKRRSRRGAGKGRDIV